MQHATCNKSYYNCNKTCNTATKWAEYHLHDGCQSLISWGTFRTFLVRPKTIVFGRTSLLLWFLFSFFFPPHNLQAPSADRHEILHDAPNMFDFIIPGQNFWVSLPEKKILRAENMQNLARIWSTSKFGGQFLQNGWRYSKSVSYSFDIDSSRIRRNKSVKFGPVTLEI